MKLCSPAPHPVSAEAPSTGGRSRDAACQPGPRAPSYTVTCCLVAAPPLPASQPSPPLPMLFLHYPAACHLLSETLGRLKWKTGQSEYKKEPPWNISLMS
ncbi:unnamed protein product [Eretmochelys imbricata]